MPKKPTTFSMRMPEDINDRIQAYAAEHECTKAEAMSHFVRAGIELEDNGTVNGSVPTTNQTSQTIDLSPLNDRLDKLQTAVDKAAELASKPETGTIIPADIRERIKAYSSEHGCSDEESLGYFARIGITMTADDRPVSRADLAEVAKKLDAIAADGAAKNEQLKSLSETVEKIRGYTEPESVEVEGELADPAIEEAKDALEEERREAERDERTRKIINEAMDSYLERNKPQPQQSAASTLMPVLVAALIALVIGIVVILVILLAR